MLRQLDEGLKGRECYQDRDFPETLFGKVVRSNLAKMFACQTKRTKVIPLKFRTAADLPDDFIGKIHESERGWSVAEQADQRMFDRDVSTVHLTDR